MGKVELSVENWGHQGSAEGLLFVCPYAGFSPGYGSTLVDSHLENTGQEILPVIPVILQESFYSNDSYANLYLSSLWPAIVTGGRPKPDRGRRGNSHYEIMIEERAANDSAFIAGFVKNMILQKKAEALREMHLTWGVLTIRKRKLEIESDLRKIIAVEDLKEINRAK